MSTWDYVVVGGGSAGCVVAAGLSEDPSVRVLLIEAGGHAEDHPETLRADGYKDAFVNDAVIWTRHTRPQAGLGGRRVFVGTGTGMGGSGSVNGMVYTRGAREDFDAWPRGWRWDDVVPAFEAVEARLRVRRRDATTWTAAALDAAEATGFRRKDDLNDGDLSGVMGYEWMNQEGEHRRSSYVAFLKDVARPNLDVVTHAHVERIGFDAERRARKVVYRHGGALREARVGREVVLCAGALETPRLLLLSGVGPAAHLADVGVDVVADAPGVGGNLHDHPNVILLFRGTADVDCMHPQLYGFHRANPALPLPPRQSDTCYVLYPARSSLTQALERMVPSMVLPGAMLDSRRAIGVTRRVARFGVRRGAAQRLIERAWGVVVILGKPKSRGWLRLASADPSVPADIDPAYLSDPADLDTLVRGVERARALADAAPLGPWRGTALLPLPWVRSRAAIERHVRGNAITTYHFAGTCRMGEGDDAPVDPSLRLRGVQGVRVADASVIPETPVSALNAPSMMIAWRAVALLRGA